MAQIATSADRVPSTLASNNPFRNRLAEPSPGAGPTPTSLRPVSNNPFLDATEVGSPDGNTQAAPTGESPKSRPGAADKTADLFGALGINGATKPLPAVNGGTARRENVAPKPFPRDLRGSMPRHRPSNSDEERRREQAKSRGVSKELDIFADPPELNRARDRRPQRRNSESSVRDKTKDLDPEAERRRKERRAREAKGSYKSKKASGRLDIIDKLDVTSIYGTGLFHHDGPFDACNPHRNRKGSKQAPMQAFPKDSINMQLGGAGPVNSKLDLEQYHGMGQEAHVDYNEAAVADDDAEYFRRPPPERSASFNPTTRTEPVHGYETAGLGTSTFLEGAPASRAAIQRRQTETAAEEQFIGLSRKKSLAQRIKSVRPKLGDSARVTSPEPLGTPVSPAAPGKVDPNAPNPFFKDYDKEYERKGAQIAFAEEQQKIGRSRATSSPRRGLGLERKITSDSQVNDDSKMGGGFLSRVKSMKGRSRTRERRNTETS